MATYLWVASDEDATHDWFEACDDATAIERARELVLPVFDMLHVQSMVFEVWLETDQGGCFVCLIKLKL